MVFASAAPEKAKDVVLMLVNLRSLKARGEVVTLVVAERDLATHPGVQSADDYLSLVLSTLGKPAQVSHEAAVSIGGRSYSRLSLPSPKGGRRIFWASVLEGHALYISGEHKSPLGRAELEQLLAVAEPVD